MKEIREYRFKLLEGTVSHLDLRANTEGEIPKGSTCVICGQPLKIGWTIQHGVAECVYCGAPYQVYHRDKKGKLLSRVPTSLIQPEAIAKFSEAWKQSEDYGEFRQRCKEINEAE